MPDSNATELRPNAFYVLHINSHLDKRTAEQIRREWREHGPADTRLIVLDSSMRLEELNDDQLHNIGLTRITDTTQHTPDPPHVAHQTVNRTPFDSFTDNELDDLAVAFDMAAGEGAFSNPELARLLATEADRRGIELGLAYGGRKVKANEWQHAAGLD